MIASLLLLGWGIFQGNISIPSLKSALCLGLGEWSFPRYKAHASSSSVILYNPRAYQQFDLESQLSSSFAFHLIGCINCFAIFLWYGEDESNAVLVMRGNTLSGFSEEITFCMIVINTEGLWYVKTLKTFQDSNANWQERLPKEEETRCGLVWWLLTWVPLETPGGLAKTPLDPTPRVSDLVFLGQSPRICISNAFPGSTAAGGPRSHFEN